MPPLFQLQITLIVNTDDRPRLSHSDWYQSHFTRWDVEREGKTYIILLLTYVAD